MDSGLHAHTISAIVEQIKQARAAGIPDEAPDQAQRLNMLRIAAEAQRRLKANTAAQQQHQQQQMQQQMQQIQRASAQNRLLLQQGMPGVAAYANGAAPHPYPPPHQAQNQLQTAAQYAQQHRHQRQASSSSSSAAAAAMLASMPQHALGPAAGHLPLHPTLSQAQVDKLQDQVAAFRHLQRNLPIPEMLQPSIYSDAARAQSSLTPATNGHSRFEHGNGTMADAAAQFLRGQGDIDEQAKIDPVATFQSFTSPFHYLAAGLGPTGKVPYAVHATKLQRLLIPATAPPGVDPVVMLAERERQIRSRINHRIYELEHLPGSLAGRAFGEAEDANDVRIKPDPDNPSPEPLDASVKLRAIIELKALRLVDKQRKLRVEICQGMQEATTLLTAVDRDAFKRKRRLALRDARATERLERQQRTELDARRKQRHHHWIRGVEEHAKDLHMAQRERRNRQRALGQAVLSQHRAMEREFQRRGERMKKERIRLLATDNEEEYRRLVSEAKDSRLNHLLRETDSYLERLTAAVELQQQDRVHADVDRRGQVELMDEVAQPEVIDGDETEDARKQREYFNVAHRIRESVSEQPPNMVGGKLKEYQIRGLEWMVSLYNNRLNGILADEMGLGKTIQTIALVTHLISAKKQMGPYLIIVPLSTITNWHLEFSKWAPSVSVITYKGDKKQRKALEYRVKKGDFQVLLTTYEYVVKDKGVLSKIKWVHMIIDEGHRMKNKKSKLSTMLVQYYSTRYRLILTGTPLQNNLPELWALLNFILPKIFSSSQSFDEWFSQPFANVGGQERVELSEEEQLLIIRRLHKVLRPFLLRRLKKDVESELPDKIESIIKCKMSALQSMIYRNVQLSGKLFAGAPDDESIALKRGAKSFNNILMQLKKVCNHPFVFKEVESHINPSGLSNDLLFRSSGKFELLDRILPKLFRTDHRALMFFQMTQVMDIMEDYMRLRDWQYLRLDGTTKTEDRSRMLELFNAEDSPYRAFLLSTRAGGLGLNLQTADTVIIFDSDWNPHQDLQAQDRAHRIGQTKEVRIFRLLTEESVEEIVLEKARFKLDMDGKVIQAGKFDNKTTEDERRALLDALLRERHEERDDDNEFTEEELNELLARSDAERELFRRMDREREAEEKRSKAPPRLMTDAEVPKWMSVDVHASTRKAARKEGRGQRERKDVLYDDGLNEDQFADAIEREEDISEIARKKMERRRQRLGVSQLTGDDETAVSSEMDGTGASGSENDEDDESRRTSDVSDTDSPRGVKRRALSSSLELPAKRKRGRQPIQRFQPGEARLFNKIGEIIIGIAQGTVNSAFNPPRQCLDLCMRSPTELAYQAYRRDIASSVWFEDIRDKFYRTKYRNYTEFARDWEVMFENVLSTGKSGDVRDDAELLRQTVQDEMERLCPGDRLPSASTDPDSFVTESRTPSNLRHVVAASDLDDKDDGDSSESEVDSETAELYYGGIREQDDSQDVSKQASEADDYEGDDAEMVNESDEED